MFGNPFRVAIHNPFITQGRRWRAQPWAGGSERLRRLSSRRQPWFQRVEKSFAYASLSAWL